MAETVKIDASQWDAAVRGTLMMLARKDDLLVRIFKIIGIRDLIDHFTKQTGPTEKWATRKQSTQDAYAKVLSGVRRPGKGIPRAAYNPSNRILQMTGKLRQSVLDPGIKIRDGGNTLEIFSRSAYGAAHDQGSEAKNIPQREFMWLSDIAQQSMADGIRDTIMRGGLE